MIKLRRGGDKNWEGRKEAQLREEGVGQATRGDEN